MNNSKKYDQFYTNPKISDYLVGKLFKIIKINSSTKFIEPSAGSGNFIDSLLNHKIKRKNILAYDIDPKIHGIKKANYLKIKKRYVKNRITIGNPPFGKRSKLAIEFLNKSLQESEYVAMILPKQFERYLTQKQVLHKATLIHSSQIEKDSFLVNDKRYNVNCVFQIWSLKDFGHNIRLLKQKPIRHPDFMTYIHNNTKKTLKYFDKNKFQWDIAVHRQGFYDYSEIITDPKNLKKNRQYFFIKYLNSRSKDIIKKINFEKLSKLNTQTPGFSTTDFVSAYQELEKIYKNEIK